MPKANGIFPQGYNYSYMNIFVPWEDNLSGLRYIAPASPVQPYRPWKYADPAFTDTAAYSGYGKPTSYLYPLDRTGSATENYWKNFGVFGISSNYENGSFRDGDLNDCTNEQAFLSLTLAPNASTYNQKAAGNVIKFDVQLGSWYSNRDTAIPAD